eukprot:TRINITY_DN14_c0_g1_i1.p1 TRINITY_DN14_c0_g1~~TRINITY_DN14_c0_g1_i1.p1  ORF type:complete len:115 (-),score=14.71 TRINITY_DN14_c0_g1_i1:149-493(-)
MGINITVCKMSLYSSYYFPKRFDYAPLADPYFDRPARDAYWSTYWRDYHHKDFVADVESSRYWDTYWNDRYRPPYARYPYGRYPIRPLLDPLLDPLYTRPYPRKYENPLYRSWA